MVADVVSYITDFCSASYENSYNTHNTYTWVMPYKSAHTYFANSILSLAKDFIYGRGDTMKGKCYVIIFNNFSGKWVQNKW